MKKCTNESSQQYDKNAAQQTGRYCECEWYQKEVPKINSVPVLEYQYFYCSTGLQSKHYSPWNEYMNLSTRRGGNHDAANNNNNNKMDHHRNLPVVSNQISEEH